MLIAGSGRSLSGPNLAAPTPGEQILAAWHTLQNALTKRLVTMLPQVSPDGLPLPPGIETRAPGNSLSAAYDLRQERHAMTLIARLILKVANPEKIAAQRRHNYRRWSDATRSLPHCGPLFPDLAPDCVPDMFPLHIDLPDTDFYLLKRAGLPIWRWDEQAESDWPIAARYRHRLLHLPCHQELSNAKLDWMIGVVTQTVGADR